MTFGIDSHIKSVEDVKTFFHHLVDECNVNLYPNNDFSDYISCEEDGTHSFTEEVLSVYNRFKK